MLSEYLASFRAWLETQTAGLDDAGLSVGVLHGSRLAWTWSRGMADRERSLPVMERTRYPIASIYKSFIATGILQLYEAGALRLDDPITDLLPRFRMRGYDRDDPIRIRHLLSHTAGLPKEEPFPVWTTVIAPDTDRLMRALAEQDLIFAPGSRTKYSNLGYTLLGLIAESATKTSIQSYLQDALLSPLGIAAASFAAPPADLACGYGPAQPGGRRRSDWLELRSASGTGLSLTLADLARFAELQLTGGTAGTRRLLRASSVREMHRIHGFLEPWSVGYGLGFYLRRHGERQIVSHGGTFPGYVAQLTMLPEQGIACVALGNADDVPVFRIALQRVRELSQAMDTEAAASSSGRYRPEWECYLGRYADVLEAYEVRVENDRLALARPGGEVLSLFTPVAEHVFRMDGGEYFGELLRFELDEGRRVRRVAYGSDYFGPDVAQL